MNTNMKKIQRTYFVDLEKYKAAKKAARKLKTTVSDEIRRAIEALIDKGAQ